MSFSRVCRERCKGCMLKRNRRGGFHHPNQCGDFAVWVFKCILAAKSIKLFFFSQGTLQKCLSCNRKKTKKMCDLFIWQFIFRSYLRNVSPQRSAQPKKGEGIFSIGLRSPGSFDGRALLTAATGGSLIGAPFPPWTSPWQHGKINDRTLRPQALPWCSH